jgi:hypothetical protein
MSEQETQTDLIEFQKRIRKKYTRLSLFIFILGIIFILWAFIVTLGIYIWNYSSNWALISFENWIIVVSVIIVIFVLIEIAFYSRFSSLNERKILEKKPVEFINGKRVFIYTYPKGTVGGIFSKTYIDIDEQNILRLRTLMIPPGEIWGKTE